MGRYRLGSNNMGPNREYAYAPLLFFFFAVPNFNILIKVWKIVKSDKIVQAVQLRPLKSQTGKI
jgi:hypothetical protein